jgi:ferredoxin
VAGHAVLEPTALQALIDALRGRGYRPIGPVLRQGAITLGDLTGVEDIPRGIGDSQEKGHYRVRERGDDLLFGFAAAAQSAKSVLFPPDELLWRGRRTEDGFTVEPAEDDRRPIALIGVRGCDLAAIGIHDTVLLGREAVDAHYAGRRADAFLVAVTCGSPAGTCFCASMGTGPKPGPGADLTLTELTDPHRFLVEPGTQAGEELLAELPTRPATQADLATADQVVTDAVAAMGRTMRTDDLHDLLLSSAESARWDDVASRCLACTNCTTVCPTCFCTSIEDVSDLTGDLDERHRVWDSCFSMEYSRLHGGAVRTWVGSRYRQWLTHKLATWHDQFDSSGCVGCGRCITWCPAAIDLTEEVTALRELAAARETLAAGSTRGPRRHRAPQEQ